MQFKEIFMRLSTLDISKYVTTGATGHKYLPWAAAYKIMSQNFNWMYKVATYDNNKPYLEVDGGFIVKTTIIVEKETSRSETLYIYDPVSMLPVKKESYKYIDRYNVKVNVPAINAALIERTIKRCLVKNIALFGLGLDFWAERRELENVVPEEEPKPRKKRSKQKKEDPKPEENKINVSVNPEEQPAEEEGKSDVPWPQTPEEMNNYQRPTSLDQPVNYGEIN